MKRKRERKVKTHHGTDSKAEVIRLALNAKRFVRSLAFGLVVIYGWLKLRGVPIGLAIGSLPAAIIVKASLVLYFFSWVFGTINDTNEQEILYASSPIHSRFPWQGYAAGVLLTVVFGIMCYVETDRHFAIFLGVFLAINVLVWQYMARQLAPAFYRASKDKYARDRAYSKLFALDVFYDYLIGSWQWYRFCYGAMAIVAIHAFTFTRLPMELRGLIHPMPEDTLIALSVFFYVLTFEAWIWLRRFKVKMSQETLREFSKKYRIVPVKDEI